MRVPPTPDPSGTDAAQLRRGALAGFAGGLFASFVMNRSQEALTALAVGSRRIRFHFEQGGQIKKSARHRLFEIEKSESATERAANELSRLLLGRRLGRRERRRAGRALHYAFGAALGAAYGAAVERFPSLAAGRGLPFGALVWLTADEISVPVARLSKAPDEYPLSAHGQSLAAHFVYGFATEAVRRFVRQRL